MSDRLAILKGRIRQLGEELRAYSSIVAREPETKVAIFGPGRSGSTLLTKIMDTHPDVFCDGECLEIRRISPTLYLKGRSRMHSAKFSTYGFKFQHNHLDLQCVEDEQGFIDSLARDGWKFIFLYRANYLRQAVSLWVARGRQIWHSRDGRLAKVIVNPDQVLATTAAIARSHLIYRKLLSAIPYLELSYEEHLSNEAAQNLLCGELSRFLAISGDFSLETGLEKTVGSNLSASIENYDELMLRVAQSEFARFADQTAA